ncbi:hypothetical protein G3A_10030 [Bacillus sp. 17376]|uniref:Site-specific recombinase n=1 Tax=Mesobacillus boroniphilus JCM 21738 TaxID=1294265 RepID=W4RLB7_9BACI|nr:site-specific integrase [Mesobacillus boroniphilus]ESU32672.1 hypothetical protein G3A_10030 [Bacillus sp. 17376]GAE45111.1 site-specific recombinase [Mesobacillus boroniphilus JCM 21738]
MNIKKRGDKYTCVIDVGTDGERKQKRITKSTKKEVLAAIHEIKSQVNKGSFIEPSKMTFTDITNKWLEEKENDLRYSTLKTYKQVLKSNILPKLGHLKISKITHGTLTSFVTQMNKEYKKNYVAKHIALLKMIFEYALYHKHIVTNPTIKIVKKEERKTVNSVWSEEEVKSFLEVARTYSYYPAFLIAISCGCRRGEILGMSWDAIDFENGNIYITQTLSSDGKLLEEKAKTEQSIRTIKVPSNVLAELKVLKDEFEVKKNVLKGNYLKYNLVVSSKEGTPINPRNIGRSMDSIIKKAGVPRITFHSLRHAHATLLMQKGVNIKVVSERLGHSKIQTTMDIYTHVPTTLQDEAAEIFGNIIK